MRLSDLHGLVKDNPDLRRQVEVQLDKTHKGKGIQRKGPARGEYKNEYEEEAAKWINDHALPGTAIYEPFDLPVDGGSYLPDWLFVDSESLVMTFAEVKGSWQAKNARAGRVKLKAAADRYWFFRWLALTPAVKHTVNNHLVVLEWKVEEL